MMTSTRKKGWVRGGLGVTAALLLLGVGVPGSQAAPPPPPTGPSSMDVPLWGDTMNVIGQLGQPNSFTTSASSPGGAWQFAATSTASFSPVVHSWAGLAVEAGSNALVARSYGPGGTGVWGQAGTATIFANKAPVQTGQSLPHDAPEMAPNNLPDWPVGVQGIADKGIGVRGTAPAYGGVFKGAYDFPVGNDAPKYVAPGVAGEGATGVRGTSDGDATSYGGLFSSNQGRGLVGGSTSTTGAWGFSTNGYGVRAQSANSYGAYATSQGSAVGAVSGAAGPYGGVFSATLSSGTGLAGRADGSAGIGVVGATASSSTSSYGGQFLANAGAGAFGSSQQGVGVSGTAGATGFGVYGYSVSGTGLYGSSFKGIGVVGSSVAKAGVYGSSSSSYGLAAISDSSTGLYAATSSGPAGLWAVNATPGHYAITADGNAYVNGSLYTANGGPFIVVTTSQGPRQVYGSRTTAQVVTDQGTAVLQHGHAVITFDPLYVQVAALGTTYRVFLSPGDADTAGLAVVKQTATGFEVQELGGGTGNFRFDWRVDAGSQGHAGERLAPVPAAVPAGQQLAPPAAPVLPAGSH